MKDNVTYLNEFHRQQHEEAKALLSKRRKQSLADAMRQYDQIKHGSTRMRPPFASETKAGTK